MPDSRANIAFLWHMHQPWYGDPGQPHYRLPWVRLHALKDYLDMIAVLDDYPTAHVTFNLVPSLLVQLQSYVAGTHSDDVLDLTRRRAVDLSLDERAWWLRNGFKIGWQQSVDPFPRYAQLLDLRGRQASDQEISQKAARFSDQDLRDLQVWFSLAWCGNWLRTNDPVVKELLAKARGFSEDDKVELLESLAAALATVLPRYRQAAAEGRIELATSPFYHPILPLLCHYPDVRVALPNVRLPVGHVDLPEDAAQQLQAGRDSFSSLMGQEPVGLWPSEGSVSEHAMALASEAGFKWAATDEYILALSLQAGRPNQGSPGRNPTAGDLVRPHRYGEIDLFFRHHYLSDRIGFDYHSWDARTAVGNLVQLAGQAAGRAPAGATPIVSVILDGENCWENYRRNGWDFLSVLYGELSKSRTLRPVTYSEYLAEQPDSPRLDYLYPGSWIGHNFSIWAGHREDQTAWELLYQTRAALVSSQAQLGDEVRTQCWEHIYIAEGSDWYWWYGDDNFSDDDATFDGLFRAHLEAVWRAIGQPVPAGLLQPIKGQRVAQSATPPRGMFTPVVDGRETHFFEWRAAGNLAQTSLGGAMQRVNGTKQWLQSVRFGFDTSTLFLAINLAPPEEIEQTDCEVVLAWSANDCRVSLSVRQPWLPRQDMVSVESATDPTALALVAYQDLLEIAIGRGQLPAKSGECVSLTLELRQNGRSLDRWPSQGAYELQLPSETSWLGDWLI